MNRPWLERRWIVRGFRSDGNSVLYPSAIGIKREARETAKHILANDNSLVAVQVIDSYGELSGDPKNGRI